MSPPMTTGLAVFDTILQDTNEWLKAIEAKPRPCDRQEAYAALAVGVARPASSRARVKRGCRPRRSTFIAVGLTPMAARRRRHEGSQPRWTC